MKRLLTIALLLVLVAATYAQKDVTKFLGIPIDGTKSEMIRKLKAKGFTSTISDPEVLEGEFNGTDVNVFIVTDNRKVWRIMLCDKNCISETAIRIRYNKLCDQFDKNSKYINASLGDNKLSDEEDISYEISVHDKRYEAVYFQTQIDSSYIYNQARESLSNKYTKEQLDNPTEEIKNALDSAFIEAKWEHLYKKQAWFMIDKYGGEYYIRMFYDNKYNQADGEDL